MGFWDQCNAPGPFGKAPSLGGAGCTDVNNMFDKQLTLCMSSAVEACFVVGPDADCTGECFGTAIVDDCGVCEGTNADKDCNGDCYGTALLDDCNVCSGGNSGHVADSDKDCNGDCFGEAVVDDCGVCGGLDADKDDCGVCNGANADKDCSGECFGNLVDDAFGICGGDGSIQGAINNSNDGDTVNVPDGTYTESILLNKSINLNCDGTCTIDARGIDSRAGVVIEVTGATINGFNIVGDSTMYAGVIVTPSCVGVTVSNNTIFGMSMPNPNNTSPLSYGILTYGFSAEEMPLNSTFTGNNIYGVAGSGISFTG